MNIPDSSSPPSELLSSSSFSDSGWLTPHDDDEIEAEHAQPNPTHPFSPGVPSDSDLCSFYSASSSLSDVCKNENEEGKSLVMAELAPAIFTSTSATASAVYIPGFHINSRTRVTLHDIEKKILESIPGLETIAEEDEYQDEDSQQIANEDELRRPGRNTGRNEIPVTSEILSCTSTDVHFSERASYSVTFDGDGLIEDEDSVLVEMDSRYRLALQEQEQAPEKEHDTGQLASLATSFSSIPSSRTMTAIHISDDNHKHVQNLTSVPPGGNGYPDICQCQSQTPVYSSTYSRWSEGNGLRCDNYIGVRASSLAARTIWSPIELKMQRITLACSGKYGHHRSSTSTTTSSEAVALAAMEESLDGIQLEHIMRTIRDARQRESRCLLDIHFEFGAHRWCLLPDELDMPSSDHVLKEEQAQELSSSPLSTILTAIKKVPAPVVFHCIIPKTEVPYQQGVPFWLNSAYQDPVVRVPLQSPRARSQALHRHWTQALSEASSIHGVEDNSDVRTNSTTTLNPATSSFVPNLDTDAARIGNSSAAAAYVPKRPPQPQPPAVYLPLSTWPTNHAAMYQDTGAPPSQSLPQRYFVIDPPYGGFQMPITQPDVSKAVPVYGTIQTSRHDVVQVLPPVIGKPARSGLMPTPQSNIFQPPSQSLALAPCPEGPFYTSMPLHVPGAWRYLPVYYHAPYTVHPLHTSQGVAQMAAVTPPYYLILPTAGRHSAPPPVPIFPMTQAAALIPQGSQQVCASYSDPRSGKGSKTGFSRSEFILII
jgi:hypothetical protein